VDDDTINESCHQVSALSKRQLVQSRWPALTTGVEPLGQGCTIDVLLGLGREWPQWRHAAMLTLRPLLASALTLLALAHLREVDSAPPSVVAFEGCQDIPQRLTARVQGLGQPCPPLRPCQFRREESRRPQDAAAGLPPHVVPSLCGRSARRAAPAQGEAPCLRTASAEGSMGAGG
jgi:hypothetical protein